VKKVLGIYEDSSQWQMLAHLTEKSPMIGAIFLLGVSTGLRISDLLALRVEDVGENFQVVESKTKKIREIHLPKNIWRNLKDYIDFRGLEGSDKLFPTTRQTVHKYFALYGHEKGIRSVGTHSMRVTYAWNVYRRSTCLLAVKKAMNHKYISTTILYLVGGLEWLVGRYMGEFGGIEPCFSGFEGLGAKKCEIMRGG